MNESLTNRQIAFIIFGVLVGYGVMGLPKNVAENTGTGGWFTLLIATIITMVITYMLTYLSYVHKNKTIYEYSQLLTGKVVTYIFMILYIFYYFLVFSMLGRISCETIKLSILLKTPVWALSFVFFSISYYALTKRLRVIARLCEIYGVIIIFASVMMYLAIFTQGKLVNIKPFFILEDLPVYMKASVKLIFPFLGIEILTIIPFDKKNGKNVFKYTIFMVAFIGLFYILVAESCISVMGVDGIIHYNDALLATIRRTDIKSLQFVRRLDGIFLVIWTMAIFCTMIIWAYGGVLLLSKWFKKIPFNLLSFTVVFLAYIVSLIPSTFDQVQKILDYMGYYGFVCIIVIPSILFFITKVKKYDKKM
ncbi:GerAB/ArcD/ProY family transporter [Crassaminicella thermophila]|uniref:GerAB/ArcD/ProY family transporter n=1 Tax=Crassaminicella thermophila TaxID=2599308 RepID=A0A5C0SAK1_CRATE|nr:endospore germination permease [Crassaminicella thermophila]QEK10972.1 GerAB/ArcD/ProY family transporter [Crassaminicella thermophila]